MRIVVVGSGGHAKVMVALLKVSGVEILGIVDREPPAQDFGLKYLGNDEIFCSEYSPNNCELVLGVGSIDLPEIRTKIFSDYKGKGFRFFSAIHPMSWVSPDSQIGEGTQIHAGVVVQPGCVIGENVILNTKCSVDHDCLIGAHTHVAPGVTLSGGVKIGEGSHLGTGATVVQGIVLGPNSFVGAGSLVTKSNPEGYVRLVGAPARALKV
jgi:sugar O-acyltransferase (sialic acid O-acetyltransferase NeuD family)